jgi:hypothetical protein
MERKLALLTICEEAQQQRTQKRVRSGIRKLECNENLNLLE